MGNTPGIPSRAVARDSGSTFNELPLEGQNFGGPFSARSSTPESGLAPNPEALRQAALSLESNPRFSFRSFLSELPSTRLDFGAGARAQSFFNVPVETRPRDAETLTAALENFRNSGSQSENRHYLRALAQGVADQVAEAPAVETRLERLRLLADAYSALTGSEAWVGDRTELERILIRWLEELSSHPIDDETRIADLSRIAGLADRIDSSAALSSLGDAVQGQVDEWRNIPGRQRAFRLLEGTWQALGETGRNLFQDLLDELDGNARTLERQAEQAAPAARIQALGEIAALYRLLANHPEAGEHYLQRWRQSIETILERVGSEEISPALRLQVRRQILSEWEGAGENERAQSLRQSMESEAEQALVRGRRRQGAISERYQALLEAHGIFRELGEETGVQRSSASLRRFLAEMEHAAAERSNVEVQRQVAALSLEAYLEIGDLDAAEIRLGELRQILASELEQNEPRTAAEDGIDPRAQWLLRLGSYAQRIAAQASELSGEAPDFSLFREILTDLGGLGVRSGQASMALYGRFMRAVLDQDPAAANIYEELQNWRPEPFAVWRDTPALFFPEAVRNYQADPFQRMAEEIWRVQGPMSLLPRATSTLQFLSLLIEGNFNSRRAAAAAANQATAPIEEERDRMRRYLSHVQSLLTSGRAQSTREAIFMLPQILGEERAAQNFYRSIESAFGAGNLASRLIDSEAIVDPEVRAQAWLSLAREMIVADSLNHRADAMIETLLEAAEQNGGRGRAPRPLLEILRNLASENRDLDDFAELHNRIAGNETLRQQIQGTRDAGLYVQTMNQVVDSVLSVEGGAIMLASIFTAGLAAELAGAAMLARLGSGAFTVVNGVSRMTWAARLTVGATRIGAAWVARSATELGGIAAYRSWTGRRAMSFEEIRVRLITSLFCSVGDEFATHLTRALLGRALGQHHAITEVAEFFASGLGEMWGEDLGARAAGQAADTRPFLVRYFEETLHGSFFVAGTRIGAPLAAALHSGWQNFSTARPPRPAPAISSVGASAEVDLEINVEVGVSPRRGTLAAGLLSNQANPRIEHFRILRFYNSGDRRLVELSPLRGGETTSFALTLEENGQLQVDQEISFIPAIEGGSGDHRFFLFDEWLESAAILAVNSPELEDFTRDLGRAWEDREISFPTMLERMRTYIRQEIPIEGQPGLLASLAATLARQDLIEAAHQILEEENLSLRDVVPDLPDVWDTEEDLARVQLVQALADLGRFDGEINPVYHLTKIRHSGARFLAWRNLLTGLVVRGQWQRAQDLLTSFERNPRFGTPLEERPALRELLLRIIHESAPRRSRGGGGNGGTIAALLAAGSGLATLFSSEVAHAAFEVSDAASSDGWWTGLGLALGGLAIVAGRRRRRSPPAHPYVPFLSRWIGSVWHYSGHDAAFVEASAGWARRFENHEISVDDLALGLRRLIHESYPDANTALLYELAMSFAESGLIEPVHRLLEEENIGERTRQAIPNVPNHWYMREGEIRLALMEAMVRQGVFDGPFTPLYQLNRIRHQSQRLQGWRTLIEGLVDAGRVAEAQDLAAALNRNHEDSDVAYEAIGVQIALHGALEARRRNGGNSGGGGILASALLAAGAGAAAWLGPALAQAQAASADPGSFDWVSGLIGGGGIAAGLYFIYRHSHPVRLRALRAQLDSLTEDSSAELRRETADWLFEERRADPEHFYDGSHYYALRRRIEGGSLAALDVYLRLLERDDPVARQLLSANDRQACERLILRQMIGGRGLDRLIYATLDARLSVDLMGELTGRLNRPAVFARIRDGIKNGSYRESQILLRALERANPDQQESLEDLLHLLRTLEQKNFFHVRGFLGRVRARPDLSHWLAAGIGVATWFSAEVAEASVGIATAQDWPAWLSGAALLGGGVLAAAVSGGGSARPPSAKTLARSLFLAGPLSLAEESLRDRFIARFLQMSPAEKAPHMADLRSALQELAAAGSPLSIHLPFLNALLRDSDPRFALEFFKALAGLGNPTLSLGNPLAFLATVLQRRGLGDSLIQTLRELRSEEIRTPEWLRFREVIEEFPDTLELQPAELPLGEVHLIHYLDNHGRGDGATALNGVRRSILTRLYLQDWRPGQAPTFQELAVALLDDQNHLPLVSRGDPQGRRLLLNGHHRVGALITLVADGFLPEEVLARIPFHLAAEVEPEALIHRSFAGAALPNPRSRVNWQELLGFDGPSRAFLERQSLDQDLVAWIRELRTRPGPRPRRSPRAR